MRGRRGKVAVWILFVAGMLEGFSGELHAGGKSKPSVPPSTLPPAASPAQCPAPSAPGATPVRKVLLKPVGTLPFQLPNGAQVDLSADLNSLFLTAVTETRVFSPTDPSEQVNPCDYHIEIRSAVTWLELNVTQFGLSFGYTPSGSKSTVTNLTGNAGVKIGSIRMDFSIHECVGGKCSSVKATYADHRTAAVDLSMDIHFGEITTGPSLIHQTPLGNALSKVMQKGIGEMAAAPQLTQLSWSAQVRKVTPETGIIVFDAGSRAQIKEGDRFVVYASVEATSVCTVFDAVAYVRALRVDPLSTTAVVDEVLTSERSVQLGDWVVVRDRPGAQP